MTDFTLDTLELDLPALAGAFARRLREAGLAAGADRAVAFAHALAVVRPISRRRLYFTARAVFVSDRAEARVFDAVFAEVFGAARADTETELDPDSSAIDPREPRRTADSSEPLAQAGSRSVLASPGEASDEREDELPVPVAASDEEALSHKRFDALSPPELAALRELMEQLRLRAPLRRTRRARQDRHGDRVDLRRTLRSSHRSAGDPVVLRRRRRRVVPRRVVLLCDISGSMEPYARAYLQFLSCAAGPGRDSEAFVFATRLTRVTRALAARNPDRAIAAAAAAAPDWSSGTRIGEALKAFNDRHGRRGLARGAIVVILSDGWERGDPAIVGREMQRLGRLAHRIIWVNPRAAAPGFVPRAGGMAAALPHCHALLSGHDLAALGHVIEAIGGRLPDPAPVAGPEPDDEPWASATPVPGSSVAMPSGYGPSRGRTTPGWADER